MSLQTASGNLVMVSVNSLLPKYFWKGIELTEVQLVTIHNNNNRAFVRFKVQNTGNFQTAYQEMRSEGITVKDG